MGYNATQGKSKGNGAHRPYKVETKSETKLCYPNISLILLLNSSVHHDFTSYVSCTPLPEP
jgi:hypothetical protein